MFDKSTRSKQVCQLLLSLIVNIIHDLRTTKVISGFKLPDTQSEKNHVMMTMKMMMTIMVFMMMIMMMMVMTIMTVTTMTSYKGSDKSMMMTLW